MFSQQPFNILNFLLQLLRRLSVSGVLYLLKCIHGWFLNARLALFSVVYTEIIAFKLYFVFNGIIIISFTISIYR